MSPHDPLPAYDMSLSDHGFEAHELKGLTYPLGVHAPAYGEIYPLAPDMGWIRMPVPGNLDHINLWLLDDRDDEGEGYALADTGLFMPPVIEEWKKLFDGPLASRRMTRIFVTHFHPDHAGCAGWLANRNKVRVWMNRTEWLFIRMLVADQQDEPPKDVLERRIFQGYDQRHLDRFKAQGFGNFARAVSRLPAGHRRLEDGQHVRVGGRVWQVMTGGGHTPEHSCLVDHHNGVIIAGDQILPRITSNISIMDSEPDSDPLGEWLASIAKFRAALPADMLVLPAHGFPFRGLHVRLDNLADGHLERLDQLEEALRIKPLRAVDCFELLFARPVTDEVFGLAAGEAMAHLRHLETTGRAKVETLDGVGWYSAV
ncbi:MBL fold metallo-hydrolase [Sphingorhabdus sp.]|uniref:MBL fold metallo-hydrolase n=1 Tax=Sphingorhabdus sp. TaxID=1902408 RepID=UPI003C75C0B4